MLRLALYVDSVVMALGTLRANKMRSALTVLGIVIGITAIVGMTALIRGFDDQVKEIFRQMGPKTIYVTKTTGFISGRKAFLEIMKRPNLSINDARAIERTSQTLEYVDVTYGAGGPSPQQQVFYKNLKTKRLQVIGTTERFLGSNGMSIATGRVFTQAEVEHKRNLIVLGDQPAQALFPNVDPIGKQVRLGPYKFEVIGVLNKRPSVLGAEPDNFVVIPYPVYAKAFGLDRFRFGKNSWAPVMIVCVPRDDVTREQAMTEIETLMRIRHGLKLDQPNDFDLMTQDSLMNMFDQITRAVYLGLVVLSSIALLVGGIGVMAIMMISVTERTREIGVRKALGARRREILWQFLLEAGVLTSVGGILGIGLGSFVGLIVHWLAKFPVSLPLSSFAIGFGFSAGVGIFFGMYPAFKASRLDPIEALRYE